MEGQTMAANSGTANDDPVVVAEGAASDAKIDSTQVTPADKAAVGDEHTPNDLAAWQWLFSPSDMLETPSVLYSSLTVEQERYNRWKGVQLIFRIGDYMRLGNHVTCTASMFLQRFYMRRAMPKDVRDRSAPASSAYETFTFQEMAPTCIFLACKVEETHRKLHGIIEATMAVLDRTVIGVQRAEAHMYRADVTSRDYLRWKEVVLLHEERLLETLCFDLIIEQPHPIAIKACQRLQVSRDLAQLTILIINMLLYGVVCTYHDAATLAACAFLKACQYTGKDPNEYMKGTRYETHTWNEAFDVDESEIEDALATVEEQLTYHQERIVPPSTSAAQSSASTPLPGQHVSTTAMRTPSHLADTSVTSTSPLVLTSSANGNPHGGEDEGKVGSNEILLAVQQKQEDVSQSSDIAMAGETIDTPMNLDDQRAVQRETRTDSFRPVSRHGSKQELGGLAVPPPLPLSKDAAPNSTVDPTAPSTTASGDATVLQLEPKKAEAPEDLHEEAAAAKVHHEQKDLEKREAEKMQVEYANEHPNDVHEDGSEEEGAL